MSKNADDIINNNDLLNEEVVPDNDLKRLFVDYVGNKTQPEDGQVTVEMIVEVLADEFPEFMLVIAEENFKRGYQQGLADVFQAGLDAEAEEEAENAAQQD